jgi:hypothetical protein
VTLARLARLVQPVPRAHKASKDPWVPRALSGSGDQLVLRDRPDRSDRRVRRAKPVAKAQSAPPANADPQGLRAPLARPARQDRQARRATPARHLQFASSPVPIAFGAEMTKSWLVLFARAARLMERNARRLARQQPVYVYGGDLGQRVPDFQHVQQRHDARQLGQRHVAVIAATVGEPSPLAPT